MHTKVRVGMGTSAVLVVSIMGAGVIGHAPSVYAAGLQPAVSSPAPSVTNVQQSTYAFPNLKITDEKGDPVNLDQPFATNLNNYTATVDNSTQQISFTLGSADSQASISVNGQKVINGKSAAFSLNETGDTVFEIAVKNSDSNTASQDGSTISGAPGTSGTTSTAGDTTGTNGTTSTAGDTAGTSGTTSTAGDTAGTSGTTSTATDNTGTTGTTETAADTTTYILTIHKKSSNNLLNGIHFSTGNLATNFTPQNTDYNLMLPSNATSITISPQTADKTAVVTVNGQPLSGGNAVTKLPVDQIKVDVKAENGDIKSYVFQVVHPPVTIPGTTGSTPGQPGGKPVPHPGQPGGKPVPHPGQPTGKPGLHSGQSTGKSGSKTGAPTGKSGFKTGSKTGASTGKSGYKTGSKSMFGSGKTAAGSFTAGSKTAGNSGYKTGAGSNFGSFGQQKGSAAPKVSTALLSSLSVSSGAWNKAFDPNTFTYHITVAGNVNSVTIEPGAKYSDATVSINGGNDNVAVLSGIKTIVPVVVTRGTDQKTYVLVFDKPAPPATSAPAINVDSGNAPSASLSIVTSPMDSFTNDNANGNGTDNSGSQGFWITLINSIKAFFLRIL